MDTMSPGLPIYLFACLGLGLLPDPDPDNGDDGKDEACALAHDRQSSSGYGEPHERRGEESHKDEKHDNVGPNGWVHRAGYCIQPCEPVLELTVWDVLR